MSTLLTNKSQGEKINSVIVTKLSLVAGFILLTGCSLAAPEYRATAELKDKDGKIVGQAFFRERSDGVLVRIDVKGLTPGCTPCMFTRSVNARGRVLPPPLGTSILQARNMA
jgi:Cu/Zn superoxide dismutase